MLEGGRITEGTFIPLTDPALRSEIETVLKKIDRFREFTEQRFIDMQESGTGTQIDQRYDTIFKDFINQADSVESELQAEILSENHVF